MPTHDHAPLLGAPGTDDDATRAMDALRRLVSALRSASRTAVHDVGVTGAQLFVLRSLSDTPNQSVSELAQRTGTRQNSVSDVVSRLVRRGLVRRDAAEDDARRAVVSLTPTGRVLLRRAPMVVQETLLQSLRELPASQRRALAGALEAWVSAAGLEHKLPTMFFEKSRPRRGAVR